MMRCDWKYVGPSQKMEGFRYYECSRVPCKMYAHSPYEASNIVNDNDSPCQGRPRVHEWGGWLELFLESWFFVSKSRWLWVKRKCGLKPGCNCPKREVALNRLGQWIVTALAASYSAASGLAVR